MYPQVVLNHDKSRRRVPSVRDRSHYDDSSYCENDKTRARKLLHESDVFFELSERSFEKQPVAP